MSINVAKSTFFLSLCASRITSFLLLTLSNCQAGIGSRFFHSLSTAAFASEFSSLEASELTCAPGCHVSSNCIFCLRCDLHDLLEDMIPNAFSWTHQPPRCTHALSLESCWIHHSSLHFPKAKECIFVLFLHDIAASIGTSNFHFTFF